MSARAFAASFVDTNNNGGQSDIVIAGGKLDGAQVEQWRNELFAIREEILRLMNEMRHLADGDLTVLGRTIRCRNPRSSQSSMERTA